MLITLKTIKMKIKKGNVMKLLSILALCFLTTNSFATECLLVVSVDAQMFAVNFSLDEHGSKSAAIGAIVGTYTRDEVNQFETLELSKPGKSVSSTVQLDANTSNSLNMNDEYIAASFICTNPKP